MSMMRNMVGWFEEKNMNTHRDVGKKGWIMLNVYKSFQVDTWKWLKIKEREKKFFGWSQAQRAFWHFKFAATEWSCANKTKDFFNFLYFKLCFELTSTISQNIYVVISATADTVFVISVSTFHCVVEFIRVGSQHLLSIRITSTQWCWQFHFRVHCCWDLGGFATHKIFIASPQFLFFFFYFFYNTILLRSFIGFTDGIFLIIFFSLFHIQVSCHKNSSTPNNIYWNPLFVVDTDSLYFSEKNKIIFRDILYSIPQSVVKWFEFFWIIFSSSVSYRKWKKKL